MQQGGTEGKRIAALVGDGFEEVELPEPRRALEAAGAIVTIVGVDERARAAYSRQARSRRRAARAQGRGTRCRLYGRRFRRAVDPGRLSPDRIHGPRSPALRPGVRCGEEADVRARARRAGADLRATVRGSTLTGSPRSPTTFVTRAASSATSPSCRRPLGDGARRRRPQSVQPRDHREALSRSSTAV